MSDKPRLPYEKPVSIDLGRVAPILGDTCSVGDGAADCPAGMNNGLIPVCMPSGSSADNDCRTGASAGTFCWPTGSGAAIYCLMGSGFKSASSYGAGGTAPSSFGGSLDSLGGTESPADLGGEPGGDGISGPGAF